MRIGKAVFYVLAGLGALVAFGWFFLSQLGSGSGRQDELAAVIQAPPADYAIVERGELSPAAAAAELEAQIRRPGAAKVGVRFERRGAVVYWLADLGQDLLEERSAGPSGTRLQTLWPGSVRERLRWARTHGNLDAPGLPPPQRRNLYH
ncbi:MAG TPA: hypothetical protein VF756_26750 [Thermoanaerobaculia bacterium]